MFWLLAGAYLSIGMCMIILFAQVGMFDERETDKPLGLAVSLLIGWLPAVLIVGVIVLFTDTIDGLIRTGKRLR